MIIISKKIAKLLTVDQKKKIPVVFMLMVFSAVLETMSISMLVPMVSIIVNIDTVIKSNLYRSLANFFQWDSPRIFVGLFFFFIAVLFIVKNVFLYFQISYQAQFASQVRQNIQNKLYIDCIRKPYEFYLNTNTGNILRNIYVDSMGVYNSLLSLMNVLMEGVISFALVSAVIVINPLISFICILIIVVIAVLIYVFVKPQMQSVGKTYSNISGDINQWILQSTDNIKEIKVMQRESFFVNNFKNKSREYNEASCKQQVISSIPRLFIEAGVLSGVIMMLGISYANGNNLSNIIPQLSAFAVAMIRLLPSVNRLNTALNTVLFNEASIDHVIEAFCYITEKNNHNLTEKTDKTLVELTRLSKGIYIKNVSYQYPDSDKKVFDNISLEIEKGQTIGLIGESGAGKTTFVNLILGLLDSPEGDILWDDIKINHETTSFHLNIGYIPQQISLLDDTIKANIVFGAEEENEKHIRNAIVQSQLEHFIKSLPDGIMTQVGDRGVRLSGGQRQRIGIARALYKNPDFLVLDVKYSIVLIVYGVYRVREKLKIGTTYTNRKKNVYDVTWKRIRKILKSGIGSGSFFIP